MPYLKIQTNCSVDAADRRQLLAKASEQVAGLLGKPERYVMVALEDQIPLIFGGDHAPAIYMELKSIGLPEERTAELSRSLCIFAQRELGVAPDRVYIEFADAGRRMWGWNGGTF